MSNGKMLNQIKELIESGDDFTVKQYRVLSLSGMVELGENIEGLKGDIDKVEQKALSRVCPEVKQTIRDIEKLERKSNRNDTIVGIGTVVGSVVGFIFGNK